MVKRGRGNKTRRLIDERREGISMKHFGGAGGHQRMKHERKREALTPGQLEEGEREREKEHEGNIGVPRHISHRY